MIWQAQTQKSEVWPDHVLFWLCDQVSKCAVRKACALHGIPNNALAQHESCLGLLQAQMEAVKEAQFAANIGVGGDLSNLLSEDNPDGVIMITDEGKITFVNQV